MSGTKMLGLLLLVLGVLACAYGAGHESVTFGKRRRIVRAARLFASARGLSESALRFDVISIDEADGRTAIRHDRGAFDVEGA